MEAMRSTAWNDDRLDDLNHKVDRIDQRMDQRFNAMEARMDQRFNAVDARFDSLQRDMSARFDSLQRAMFNAAVVLAGAFLTAGAAIVATQI
jgi:hypothetical protein